MSSDGTAGTGDPLGRKPWEIPIQYTDDTPHNAPGTGQVAQPPPSGRSREESKPDPSKRDPSVVDAPPRTTDEFGVEDDDEIDQDFDLIDDETA